ncbi:MULTISPECIES: hypothetical protein [unclassified Streptomyces]|uniref:hypothetical protein n=1 Tax=unclassified Streptomyces TaxID=2593676 RepID=UPI000DB9CB7B|nr:MULTISPECIES: hypothetical protein [unclassified Streptomyces]MYT70263.1 hypothetical protein [Streptomyces sp. SID8367]RAJ88838.1 hypothetical protein K377_02299 [Streptomyces sp. PsTaAH-137]
MPAAPPRPDVPHRPEQERPHARLRLFGLLAVVVLTAALPLAGATAGPVDDGPARPVAEQAGSPRSGTADKVDDSPARDATSPDAAAPDGRPPQEPSLLKSLGLGLATATQCGPQLASPDGVEAQTCVLTQGRDTWARTYYRNATGAEIGAVLTLMAPGGRTVQIHCAVGAEDEPGLCETPRERTTGRAAEYAAVAEYAATGDGPLLLRSGSNSAPAQGR